MDKKRKRKCGWYEGCDNEVLWTIYEWKTKKVINCCDHHIYFNEDYADFPKSIFKKEKMED